MCSMILITFQRSRIPIAAKVDDGKILAGALQLDHVSVSPKYNVLDHVYWNTEVAIKN